MPTSRDDLGYCHRDVTDRRDHRQQSELRTKPSTDHGKRTGRSLRGPGVDSRRDERRRRRCRLPRPDERGLVCRFRQTASRERPNTLGAHCPHDQSGCAACTRRGPSHGRSLHGTVLTGMPAVVFSQCLQSISDALPHLDFAGAAQYENVVESLLKASVGHVAPEQQLRAPPEGLRACALVYILDHLGESWLSPTTICVALAVSRAQLYRAFNDEGGIAQVIRRKRLEHAYRN